jgi:hypothetical protein
MKKSLLLFVLSLITWLGYGQTITISQSPTSLRACDTVNFTITVNNIVVNDTLRIRIKNSANTQFLYTNVPSTMVNNYIQIDTIVNANTLVFNYSNRITCNASRLNIDNISTDNFIDSIKVKRNNLTEISTTKQYSANNPYYQYINNTYTAVSGDVNENIIGDLRFRNFNAPFNGFFQIIERMPTGSSIVSINVHGEQIISHTLDVATNTYTTIVKVNSNDTLFYQPTYQITSCNYSSAQRFVTVNMGCSASDICKNLVTNLSAQYNYVRKEALITTNLSKIEISNNECNIEKRWKVKVVVHNNTGLRSAKNVKVQLFRQWSGNNIPIYTFGLVDSSSVVITCTDTTNSKIIKQSYPTSATNLCGNYQTASSRTDRSGFSDSLGTYAIIDNLDVGDSIIFEYELFRCCEQEVGPFSFEEDNFNNKLYTRLYSSGNFGIAVFFKAHPCNQNYSFASAIDQSSGTLNLNQYPLCNTTHILGDLRDGSGEGESFSASVVNLSYSNTLFAANDTSYQIWVKIDSELGLYNKDSIYFQTQDGSKKWRAYFISDTINLTGSSDWKHERRAYFRKDELPTNTTIQTFFSNNSTINYTMQSYCDAKTPKTAYRITTFIKETDCNGCLMPIISGSCAVSVQCPGCFLPGTLVRKTTVERKSFGYLDANNDRLPDDYPTMVDPQNPQILKNRVMYGDTLETSMNLVVWDTPNGDISLNSLANNNKFLNRAYGILTIPGGGGMRILNTTIQFNGQSKTITNSGTSGDIPVLFKKSPSTVITHSSTNPNDTTTVTGLMISYDVSLDVLVALDFDIDNRLHFLENDTITISSNLVFEEHIYQPIKEVFMESEIVSQAYLSGVAPSNRFEKPTDYFTTALPSTIDSIDISKSFWCEDFGGYMSMVDYILKNVDYSGYGTPDKMNNCSRTASLYYSAVFPNFLTDYFPYEYRNVLEVDSVKLTTPPGYEVLDTAIVWTTHTYSGLGGSAYNNPTSCSIVKFIKVPVINNKINTTPINTYTVSNCAGRNTVILQDEISQYNVQFAYRPICNNTVALIDSTRLKIENWFKSPQSSGYFQYLSSLNFTTRKFTPTLTANSTQTQAATDEFILQAITIRNTEVSPSNSVVANFHKNAPNSFVIFKSNSGRIYSISINNDAYSNGQVYKLGNLEAINFTDGGISQKILNVKAHYNCIGMNPDLFDKFDTLTMYFGWSCNGYIDSLPQIYQSQSCLFVDSVYHYIKPLPLTKEIALATGKDTLDNCDTTSMRILLRSMSQGNLYDLVGSVIVEVPASMQPCSDSATIRYTNSNNTIATDKIGVSLDNSITDRIRYIYDLTPFTGGGLSNGDSIIITGCLQTTCTYQDVAKIVLETRSIAYCGDTINQKDSTFIHINPYQPQVRDTITVACNPVSLVNSIGTLNLTVSSNQSAISQYNSLQLTLPQGISVSGWSGSNGVYQLSLDDIMPNSTLDITANLSTAQSFDCNASFPYQVQLIQLDTVLCNSSQCQRFYIADSCSSVITIGCDTIAIVNNDTTICEGNSLSLSAFTNNANATIIWTANGSVINPINYTPNTIGTITVIAQIQNSTVADTMYITVNPDCLCPARFHYIWGSDVGIPEISASDAAFSSNSKNVLVQGRLKIKGLNSSSVLTLNRWNFSVNSQNEGAQIELEDLLFTCNGCSFVAACDTLWGGIVLHNNAGIRLDSINNKASIIRQAITGIRNNPNSTGFRQFSVNKTNFIDCVRGINLINYQRNFVVATDKISNNRFITNNNQLIAWGGYLITNTLRYAINLEQADYYNIRIQQNTINNTGLGIRLANATGYAVENTIINCLTGINTIGSYYNTRTYDIQLRRNTILLAPEGHDYNLIGQNYFNVTGIFSSGLKAYMINNTIRANFQHREFLNRHQYRGIFISATNRYELQQNNINVRDIGIAAQNLGTVQGKIIGNILTEHYYNIRFVTNQAANTNPVIAVKCNTFEITNLDFTNGVPKYCIALDAGTILNRLGDCRVGNVGIQNKPCGNNFNINSNHLQNFSSRQLWKHIYTENGLTFNYTKTNTEIPFENIDAGNGGVINVSPCTLSAGCNTVIVNNPNDPLQARSSMILDGGTGITGQDLALEKQKLNSSSLNSQQKDEAVLKIAGYYLLRKDLQGLENYTASLPNNNYKAQFSNILYNEYSDTINVSKMQYYRQYIANNFNHSETKNWASFSELNERLGKFSNPTYINTLADTMQYQQIINNSVQLNESACRRIGENNCTNNLTNLRKIQPIYNYPKMLNTGIDTLNLVPNFSFELLDSTICITTDTTRNSDGELNYNDTGTTHFAGWNYKRMTPDLFNQCNQNNNIFWLWGVPNNWRGYQMPSSGKGYSGIRTNGSPTSFEFTGTQLTKTLDTTKTYFVGFKVVSSEKSSGINNKQGILFSKSALHDPNSQMSLLNRMHVYSDSVVSDTLKWTIILKKFKPDSAYQYITIGNLFNFINTIWDGTPRTNTNCSFCYYFDDIVVTEDSVYAYSILFDTAKTTIKKHIQNVNKIKLYPNPTNGTVFINMPNPNKVYVYNTLGILTKELYLEKGEHEIDISHLPSGVYLFRIANESIKLIKE